MRRLIILIIGCLLSQSIYAQQKTTEIEHRERYIISEALLFLDLYEKDRIWFGDYDEGDFSSLFTSNASLVQDIPMINSQEQVSVDIYTDNALEYIRNRSKISLTPYEVILNEAYGSNQNSGSGKITFNIIKKVQFRSPNIINGLVPVYQDELDQRFTLIYSYDDKTGITFKIDRIESNEKKGKYIIVSIKANGATKENLEEKFGSVNIDTKEGFFRSESESFGVFTLNDYSVSRGYRVYSMNDLYFQKRKISSAFRIGPGQDIYQSPENISEINFRKKRISLSPRFGYEYKNENVSTNFNSTSGTRLETIDYSLALSIRLVSLATGSITLGVKGGSSSSNIQAELTPFRLNSQATDDAGDSYNRILDISELQEDAFVNRSFVGFELSAEKRWNQFELSIYSDLRYFMSGTYDYATRGKVKYSGLYGTEYFNIEISDPQYYGFGSYQIDLQEQVNTLESLSLGTGFSLLYDLNRRSQLKLTSAFVQYIDPIFAQEEELSFDSSRYRSIIELDPQIWLNTYRFSISINYFL